MPRLAVLLLLLPLGLLLALVPTPVPPWVPLLQEGLVFNDQGPVAGASIRLKGQPRAAFSDQDGRFTLPFSSGQRRLTAWKEGYFIAGMRTAQTLSLRLVPLPGEDNSDYSWVDPTPLAEDEQRCGNCHATLYREWAGSGHARSATGKHFRNLYEGSDWHGRPAGWSLLDEHPDGAGVCSSCHAPTVRDEDHALFDLRKVAGVDALGVHCDYCHKVAGLGEGQIGLAHGRFLHRLLRPRRGQLFFGPLEDVDRGEDAASPFYRDSRYCAVCHEGVVFGVPVYTTWSEWQRSPAGRAGKQCQDCHMKPTGRMTNLAPGHGGIERPPQTLANHVFWDGSQEQMLRKCLQLEVSLRRRDGKVEARLQLLATGVGHKVPTGFIDRQVILVVEGFTASGKQLAVLNGATLPSVVGQPYAGQAGKLHARLRQDEPAGQPIPFWRTAGLLEDSRLSPEQPEVSIFTFPPTLDHLRVRLLHRRFWDLVARSKGWPDQDLVVIDRTFYAR